MVFRGLIASSNTLLKDHEYRNELRDKYNARAVEMEASGVADAAHDSSRGYFVVRGTVDYCNEYKNDDWHRHAAVLAAAYTRSLIEVTTPCYFEDGAAADIVSSQPAGGAIGKSIKTENILNDSAPFNEVADQFAQTEQQLGTHETEGESEAQSACLSQVSSSEALKQLPPLSDNVRQPQASEIVSRVSPPMSDYQVGITTNPVRMDGAAVDQTQGLVKKSEPNIELPTRRDSDYIDLLVSHAHRFSDDIELEFKKWEYQRLFTRAAELENWLATHDKDIPGKVVRMLYYLLARVATTQAWQNAAGGGTPDYSRARFFLSRAKNVND
jgi:hypothetical protein